MGTFEDIWDRARGLMSMYYTSAEFFKVINEEVKTGTMEVWGCNFSVKTILPLATCLLVLRVKRSPGLYGIQLMVF